MKTHHHDKKELEGSALFTILVIVVTVSAMLATMTTASLQRAFMATKLADRANSVAIAEAGADWAYSVLVSNFNHRTNPSMFPAADYGEGSYSLGITPVSSNLALVYSTGVCGIASARVVVDVKHYGGWVESDDFSDDLAFDFAILAGGGGMGWGGNGSLTVSNAPIHSNGEILVNGGGHVTVDPASEGISSSVALDATGGSWLHGDCTAPEYQRKLPAQVDGTATVAPVDPVPIPSIDFTPYAAEAANNGEYKDMDGTGVYHISVGDIAPSGGILYVDGNVKITTGGDIYGAIIATGYIEISSTANQYNSPTSSNYPALMSRDSYINIGGNGEYSAGLIYTKTGDFTKTGNGLVTGTIICAGSFTKGGGWNAMVYEESTPVPPELGDGYPTELIGISAWQE